MKEDGEGEGGEEELKGEMKEGNERRKRRREMTKREEKRKKENKKVLVAGLPESVQWALALRAEWALLFQVFDSDLEGGHIKIFKKEKEVVLRESQFSRQLSVVAKRIL
ncbi:hypothetical protein BaRGS_00036649 [Batillaria attramentaria]|uniref:Uncharacterized protein n=1 Tax=Batillaria attramentaria TaxID=370345 RepID=A0ABD0JBB1_9CAEN